MVDRDSPVISFTASSRSKRGISAVSQSNMTDWMRRTQLDLKHATRKHLLGDTELRSQPLFEFCVISWGPVPPDYFPISCYPSSAEETLTFELRCSHQSRVGRLFIVDKRAHAVATQNTEFRCTRADFLHGSQDGYAVLL